MYQCLNCGADFEFPVIETMQRAGEPSYDEELCPDCGSDDIMYCTDSVDDLFDSLED